MQRTSQNISQAERNRLVKFFGQTGAAVILKHIDDLDQTFGSASQIISQIMQGTIEIAEMSKDN